MVVPSGPTNVHVLKTNSLSRADPVVDGSFNLDSTSEYLHDYFAFQKLDVRVKWTMRLFKVFDGNQQLGARDFIPGNVTVVPIDELLQPITFWNPELDLHKKQPLADDISDTDSDDDHSSSSSDAESGGDDVADDSSDEEDVLAELCGDMDEEPQHEDIHLPHRTDENTVVLHGGFITFYPHDGRFQATCIGRLRPTTETIVLQHQDQI